MCSLQAPVLASTREIRAEGQRFVALHLRQDRFDLGARSLQGVAAETALQLDIKLDGIPTSVLAQALKQARDARLHVLDVMLEAIDAPDEMSQYAPRIITVKIPVDKIGEVIGPKGKMINSIQDDTGAEITIEDDGTIYIGATDGPSADAARDVINAIANPHMPEVGERFLGTVVKTTTFGAFVYYL